MRLLRGAGILFNQIFPDGLLLRLIERWTEVGTRKTRAEVVIPRHAMWAIPSQRIKSTGQRTMSMNPASKTIIIKGASRNSVCRPAVASDGAIRFQTRAPIPRTLIANNTRMYL